MLPREVLWPGQQMQFDRLKRREFITLLGGAAASWPLAGSAQQQAMPLVGVISLLSPETARRPIAAFRDGLRDLGYHEGKNVMVDYRFVEGQYSSAPALVSDLVRRRVAVLVGATQVAQIAKQATMTVPIVFNTGADPVRLGLVASFNRPGGNLTGVVQFNQGLEAKTQRPPSDARCSDRRSDARALASACSPLPHYQSSCASGSRCLLPSFARCSW